MTKFINIIRALTIKEIIFYFAVFKFQFFSQHDHSYSSFEDYIKKISFLLEKGFCVIRIQNEIILIKNKKYDFLIRRSGSDFKVFEQIVINKEYLKLLKLIEDCGLSNDSLRIVDCGSNIGLFGFWMLNHLKVEKIISIEADLDNYKFQEFCIKKLDYNNKIKLLNKAVWCDSNTNLKISSNFRDGQQWAKSVESSSENYPNTLKSISLNQIFNEYLGQEIDILKIDIEGAEHVVFGNEPSFDLMLKNTKIIAIEIHEEVQSIIMIYSILNSYGFELEKVGETTFGYKR